MQKLFFAIINKQKKVAQKSSENDIKKLHAQFDKLSKRKEVLMNHFLDEVISNEDFLDLKSQITSQLTETKQELEQVQKSVSGLNTDITQSLKQTFNLKDIYEKADLERKQQIICSIFPRKFYLRITKFEPMK